MQEAFLKEENTQAGTEKEPKGAKKRSRKKPGCITSNGRKSDVTQVKLMEEFNLTRKQVQKL